MADHFERRLESVSPRGKHSKNGSEKKRNFGRATRQMMRRLGMTDDPISSRPVPREYLMRIPLSMRVDVGRHRVAVDHCARTIEEHAYEMIYGRRESSVAYLPSEIEGNVFLHASHRSAAESAQGRKTVAVLSPFNRVNKFPHRCEVMVVMLRDEVKVVH